MARTESFDDRLRLDYVLENDPAALARLLREPRAVLDSVGVDESALACTDDAHALLERGDKVAERANALGDLGLVEALPELQAVIDDGLGPQVETLKVPFGIRFMERVDGLRGAEVTGTASVECTFGLECKGDVDG